MRTLDELLIEIFLSGGCIRQALYNENCADTYVRRLIRQGKEKGYIKENKVIEIWGGRSRGYKYLTITAQGLQKIQKSKNYPWCKYLTIQISKVAQGNAQKSKEEIAFSVRSGNAVVMLRGIGAKLSEYVISGVPTIKAKTIKDVQAENENVLDECELRENIIETVEVTANISEIKQNLVKSWYRENNTSIVLGTSRGNLYFFPGKEVRTLLMENTKRSENVANMTYTRSVGVLVSENLTLPIYHAKHDGFGWSEHAEERERKALRQFSAIYSPIDNITGETFRGALLIYNEKNFCDIITDKYKKRKSKYRPEIQIGKIMRSLYLIPISPFGRSLLVWIISNTPEDRQGYVDDVAEQVYHARLTADPRMRIGFRYETDDGYIIDGTDMDFIKIVAAYKQTEKNKNMKFRVLCFSEQVAYYQHLWKDIECIPLVV